MKVPALFAPGSRVGFIGLGVMGGGMARCLMRKGYALHVFARRPEIASQFASNGAVAAPTPAVIGSQCELVILSLTDAGAVGEVLFGTDGLAASLRPGSIVIDTSTISAKSAREFGARLSERGVWLLDAPVSGGQQGAEDGTLGCMVGGPVQALAASRDALSAFCKTITHVGDVGAGQTVKACNQVAVTGALLGVSDAMALARAEGVDPKIMREVLMGGSARSFSLEKHGPRIIDSSFAPGFRARLMLKDLRLALDTARADGAQLPMTELAEQLLGALCDGGRADWDWSALALEVQRRSGMAIPDTPEAK